jgi:hypothetical protein
MIEGASLARANPPRFFGQFDRPACVNAFLDFYGSGVHPTSLPSFRNGIRLAAVAAGGCFSF